MINPSVFKAYDVRGLYPSEITEELFHQLGRAFVAYLGPGRFAVARDMRVSSPSLSAAFIDGALKQGGTITLAHTILASRLLHKTNPRTAIYLRRLLLHLNRISTITRQNQLALILAALPRSSLI